MCGISGIISKTFIDTDSFVRMNSIVKHRGPDGEGFVLFNSDSFEVLSGNDTDLDICTSSSTYLPKNAIWSTKFMGKVGLGHRRLAILDVSSRGHQPMCSKDERYWITYNGEVYNYVEVREELVSLGHFFETDTDTEVIISAYKEWGVDCQNKFNGMWAFAIYDRRDEVIFLSRDRFGIKPLYYWFSPDGDFYFGSEIKQFTVLNGWKAVLNEQRALDYLFYAVMDHTDETLFTGVQSILPGHHFYGKSSSLGCTNNKKLKLSKWYHPIVKKFEGTYEEAKAIFLQKFRDSIKLHLRADVPVGSALSGGLDSSSIVSCVNGLLKEQNKKGFQKTFSSCAEDKRFDERIWMDEVIKGTEVEGHFVYPIGRDVFELTESIVWHLDEPYQSQAAFLSNQVFKEARKNNVVVLLNGQGADEYLSGYGEFQKIRYKSLLIKGKFFQLYKETKSIRVIIRLILNSIFNLLPFFLRTPIYEYRIKNHVMRRMLTNKWKRIDYTHPCLLNRCRLTSVFNISSYQIFKDPLPRYLKWEDRNSMASSVEARVPFLETGLVEFTRSLPAEFLCDRATIKRILVDSMEGILPEVVRLRKDKKGFITAEEKWFKVEHFDDFVNFFKNNVKYSKGIFNEREVLRYFRDVKEDKVEFSYNYWRIIIFCVWMKVFSVEVSED